MEVDVGFVLVRLEYRKKEGEGRYALKRRCALKHECECEAELFSAGVPTINAARNAILCFNDSAKIGISGTGCVGRMLRNGPEVWEFEIEARMTHVRLAEEEDAQ